MNTEIIDSESISKDLIRQVFDAAMFKTSLDDDGDIRVHDDYKYWALPETDGRTIRFMSLFGTNPAASPSDKTAYINKVNDELKVLRAFVIQRGSIGFDYFLQV